MNDVPVIFWFIYGALLILGIVCAWRIYEKAGREGWEAIVPIYNIYVFTKIIDKPGWWTILLLIPYVNYVFLIWGTNLLSKKFGKDVGFTLGLVFLGFIFYPILAFGDAKYEDEPQIDIESFGVKEDDPNFESGAAKG